MQLTLKEARFIVRVVESDIHHEKYEWTIEVWPSQLSNMRKFNYGNPANDYQMVSHQSISLEDEVSHASGLRFLVQLHPFDSVDEPDGAMVANLIVLLI